MQYGVPQFIDVEDKIVGPLTGKQALYLLVGGGALLVIFSFFEFPFFVFSSLIIVPITLAFAFWKPKGFTVARWIMNIVNFYTSPHLYVWRREPDVRRFKVAQKKKSAKDIPVKNVSRNRIRELAWVLDTSSSVSLPYEAKKRPSERYGK